MFEKIMAKNFFKCSENCLPTDPKYSVNPKHKMHAGNVKNLIKIHQWVFLQQLLLWWFSISFTPSTFINCNSSKRKIKFRYSLVYLLRHLFMSLSSNGYLYFGLYCNSITVYCFCLSCSSCVWLLRVLSNWLLTRPHVFILLISLFMFLVVFFVVVVFFLLSSTTWFLKIIL